MRAKLPGVGDGARGEGRRRGQRRGEEAWCRGAARRRGPRSGGRARPPCTPLPGPAARPDKAAGLRGAPGPPHSVGMTGCASLCLHSRAERVFCSSAFSSVGVDLLLPPFPPPFPCLLGELFSSSSSSSSNLSIFPLPSRPCYN